MSIPRIRIRDDYTISSIIKGGWHLAGGHGTIHQADAIEDMHRFVTAGITTFDCADIYTGVEELIGRFLKKYYPQFVSKELPPVQIHTKYVPDYNALANLSRKDTEKVIDRSLKRLGVERLDMVQFAWWDYQFPGYVDTAIHLAEMQKAGKIRYIGVTNFDGCRIKEMINAGVEIVACQVQYSVLDHRPEDDLNELAETHKFYYLCYGTIAGGFLSDRYLNQPEPLPPFENRSLTKYRLIIEEFGSYELFQELLATLRSIAIKYNVGIAEIAMKYILQKQHVGGVIVGARNARHLEKLKSLNSFELNSRDLETIGQITSKSSGPKGPVYQLERNKTGKHGTIMKYNLNQQRTS
jgi:aryl-alcohol dehydrogenase-like predicted oxidoreductase